MSRQLLVRLLPLCAITTLAASALPASAQADKAAKGYALLVGVKEYKHSGFGNLAYPENDVEELAKLLDKPGSPFHKRVRVLTNTRGKKDKNDLPTAENVRKALKEIGKGRGKDETVLVALAGHGMEWLAKDPDGKGADRTYPYFCPSDADLPGRDDKKLYKTGEHDKLINLNTLMGDLGDCGAGSKLVLIDACRNELKARGAKRSLGVKKDAVPRGVAVLFSCDSGQVAWESDKLKHGVFFHFVLEGLRGKAKTKTGEVTWSRLAEYVTKCVVEDVDVLTGQKGAEQTPYEVRSLRGQTPVLLRLPAAKAVTYNTPREAFNGARTALKKGDYKALYATFTPAFGEAVIGLVALGSFMAAKESDKATEAKDVLNALDEQGLTEKVLKQAGKALADAGGKRSEMEKVLRGVGKRVKHKAGFLPDLLPVVKQLNPAQFDTEVTLLAKVKLEAVTTDGDNATGALVEINAEKQEQRFPIKFEKVNGSWLLVIPIPEGKKKED